MVPKVFSRGVLLATQVAPYERRAVKCDANERGALRAPLWSLQPTVGCCVNLIDLSSCLCLCHLLHLID